MLSRAASVNSTKANSPPAGSAKPSRRAESPGLRGELAQGGYCDDLDEEESARQREQRQRLGLEQPQIRRHADGDEKQTEQQPLERLEVGLELVRNSLSASKHAGEKRAQRHRQAHEVDQERGGDDGEERRGGEHLTTRTRATMRSAGRNSSRPPPMTTAITARSFSSPTHQGSPAW